MTEQEERDTALKVYRALCQIETGIHALVVLLDKEYGIHPVRFASSSTEANGIHKDADKLPKERGVVYDSE